jgi:NAD(P)-dependent dehydrogenase (short-subunit alcohol dehydrogenase family)/acyl carrier protein
MDLESDLGIDSIKRVEILSAVRERAPGLPELDPAALGPLRTLRQIVEVLQARLSAAVPASAPSLAPTPAAPPAPPAAAGPGVTLVPLMLAVVAEKTGYPPDMLDLAMDLESDLGIDSIKRVEILSAVRERAPGLPELDPAALGPLRTLRQIVDFLEARPPGAGATPAPTAQGAIRYFVLDERAAPAVGLAVGGLFAGPILVTPPSAVAAALARRLGVAGVAAHTDAAEIDAATGVVFVGGLEENITADAGIAIERQAFVIARRLAARFRAGGGLFVTVQDTTGPQAFERAFVAGLSALAKTAAREWPRAAVKAIALPRAGRSDEELAAVVAEELLCGGPELDVALPPARPRAVRVLEEVSARLPAGSGPRAGDGAEEVFVVSGGARGVTAAIVMALARRQRAKFVLLGRTASTAEAPSLRAATDEIALKRLLLDEARAAGETLAPRELGARAGGILAGREIGRTLRTIEATGGEALYVPCDIRDRAEVAAAVARGRERFGRVTGIIHGAGVLADARLDQKTDDQFERVFATKVGGLRALLAATEHDQLRTVALLSSIAATVGNEGQADYAMANEVLNAVAAVEAERRGEGCRVVALGYGPWQGGMVSPALQKYFLDRGVGLIPLEAGAETTADVLLARDPIAPAIVLGVGASMGADERAITADVVVDATRTPQLDDHRVQGMPVLPVAMAIEWIARSSLAPFSGERTPWCLRDFHVDRGVTLPRFETATRLQVIGKPRDGGRAFELRDERGGLRFRAHVPATWRPVEAVSPAEEVAEPDGKTILAAALYSPGHLFHGPRFQVVQAAGAFSRRSARATILGTRQKSWPAERWLTDPAALDGALQTAFLWTLELTNRHALPLAIAELVVHRPGWLVEGPLEVELSGRSLGPDRSVCDLVVRAAADGVLLTLTGVELFAVPSGTDPS